MAIQRENVIRAAEKYVAKGKLQAAIKEYRKVLAENPNDANTLNRVGDLYARIERFDEAVKLFSQIAEQYTDDGFFVKAIAIYKKIIKLDPTALTVYERLAELYHKQGLLNEARTQYQVLADYYVKHDNAASAITIYQRMAEIEPDDPSFHLKLAELYESQRLIDKATKEYRLLADLLIVGGSVDEAVQVYLTALEIASEDLDFVRDAVSGLHDTGHVGGAAKVLARAVELNPEAAVLAGQVGLVEELGSEPEAEDAVEAVAEPAPEAPGLEPPEAEEALPEAEDVSGDDTFSTTGAFELPEASFEGIEEVLEESGISPVEDTVENEAFTLDLEDDEPPESLVTPPDDMLEASASTASAEIEPADQVDDFDIDLEFDVMADGFEAGEVVADEVVIEDTAAAEVAEVEIEWPLDGAGELDLPDLPGSSADVDLDDTVPGQRVGPAVEPLELDAFDLDEPSLEPVEHVAAGAAGDEPELEPEPVEPEPPAPQPSAEVAEPVLAEETADSGHFHQRREEDLLAESKVFFKYGLQEKARDRLAELFQVRPDHLEGLDLQTRIELEAGQLSDAMTNANLVSRIAAESGEVETWQALRSAFDEAGFTIQGDRVVGEPGKKVGGDDRIAQLLDDLSLDAYDVPVRPATDEIPIPSRLAAAEAAEDDTASVEPAEAELTVVEPDAAEPEPAAVEPDADEPTVAPEVAASEPAAAPEPGAEPAVAEPAADAAASDAVAELGAVEAPAGGGRKADRQLISLVEELGLEDLEETLDDKLATSPAAVATPAPAPPPDVLDDTGMSWLDDLESDSAAASEGEEKIFEEEDDFFDLAAELARELSEDEAGASAAQAHEQSLEDIIEGFKQGVAENLSAEDFDTHFNLGIAYREMGLLDEAIGEFQLSAKDERYVVDSSSLLGVCFLEKGLPELAVRSYRQGLESPTITEDATLGLLYDMGTAYQTLGDSEAAYKTFVEVYGRNSHYRDVATKLQELKVEG